MINLRRRGVSVLAGVLLSLSALASPASATVGVTSFSYHNIASASGNYCPNTGPSFATPDPAVKALAIYPGCSILPAGNLMLDWDNGIGIEVEQSYDGNLCISSAYTNIGGGKVWCAGTDKTGGSASFAVWQTDGNFVVYNASQSPVWATGTNGSNEYLALQSDGNVVIYRYSSPYTPLQVLWASGTNL